MYTINNVEVNNSQKINMNYSAGDFMNRSLLLLKKIQKAIFEIIWVFLKYVQENNFN